MNHAACPFIIMPLRDPDRIILSKFHHEIFIPVVMCLDNLTSSKKQIL